MTVGRDNLEYSFPSRSYVDAGMLKQIELLTMISRLRIYPGYARDSKDEGVIQTVGWIIPT